MIFKENLRKSHASCVQGHPRREKCGCGFIIEFRIFAHKAGKHMHGKEAGKTGFLSDNGKMLSL